MTEKQLYKRVKALSFAAAAAAAVLLICILVQCISLSNLTAGRDRLEEELSVLSREAEALEGEIEYRESKEYVEQYARENLGMGYANEHRYIAEED